VVIKQLQTVECDGFDIIYFALPKGGRLELFDYHGKSRNPVRKESDSGLRHLAFQVEDVLAHERLLIAEGVTITLTTRDLPNLKSRVLLFLDPDGTVIEFCERNTK
jgi:catechol 2,3-dioxygenase-like lactoylglutathione lyase family enzyme